MVLCDGIINVSTLASDLWEHRLFLNGFRWSEKFSKVKKESNCVPGEEQEEEIQASFGTPLVDFQPRFSLHKAGNSQRGGRPWLLIYSHVVVLLGLCLGTEWSTIKQKLRLGTAAPVHPTNI